MSPGPASARLSALWTLQIAAQDSSQVRRAVMDLEYAVSQAPQDPALWSDLAAARLVLADARDEPRLIVDGITAAGRAIGLDSTLAEARFNYALGLDRFHLPVLAIPQWERFLDLNVQAGWADEAREYLSIAKAPRFDWSRNRTQLIDGLTRGEEEASLTVGRDYATEAEAEAVEKLLPQWVDAVRDGRSAHADSLWDLTVSIQRATASAGEGRVVTAVVRRLAQADAESTRRYGELISDLGAGIDSTAAQRYGPAHDLLLRAEAGLDALDSPLALVALDYLARIAWVRRSEDDTDRYADRAIHAASDGGSNHWVAAAWRWKALVAAGSGRMSDAQLYWNEVLEHASTTDRPVRVRTLSDLASRALALHDLTTAGRMNFEALGALRSTFDLQAPQTVYRRVGQYLSQVGAPELGAATLLWRAEQMRELGDHRRVASALRERAQLNLAMGRTEEADRDLRGAVSSTSRIRDATSRETNREDNLLVFGEVAAHLAPTSALDSLEIISSTLASRQMKFDIARLHLARAQAHITLGSTIAATASLEAAIDEIEAIRDSLDIEDRTGFQDRARPIFEQLIAQRFDSGDGEGSFDLLERLRGRVLFDDLTSRQESTSSAVATADDLRRRLPPGTAVLSYGVLSERTVMWLIEGGGVEQRVAPLGRDAVRGFVDALRGAIVSADADGAKRLGSQLYEALVAPFEAQMRSAERVIVIPDRALHYLPFAALRSDDGDYLTESHELVVSPSASILIAASDRMAALFESGDSTVLAVGNPTFSSEQYVLPYLPRSEAEANEVAGIWGGAGALVGADATRAAFLDRLTGASIVHFAGHAVVRPESPMESFLLFASSVEGESAELRNDDLSTLRLPRTRLVVLSACETADGRLSDTEGATSLARGFIAAGVPGVVSSLWAVRDDETADFFSRFHEHLRNGATAAGALRRAQEESVAAGVSPMTWAAFQYTGGL